MSTPKNEYYANYARCRARDPKTLLPGGNGGRHNPSIIDGEGPWKFPKGNVLELNQHFSCMDSKSKEDDEEYRCSSVRSLSEEEGDCSYGAFNFLS